MEHDARSVANELIQRARESGKLVTPLQVMKLVYFCHAWMLGIYGRPLLKQPIEAWRYGPVPPLVYHSLKHYRSEPVEHLIDGIRMEKYDDYERNVINQVWEVYRDHDGIELSSITHKPGTPWDVIWKKYGQNTVIPDDQIKSYYTKLLETSMSEE